ncbi:MAG: ribulose-phosphate 3-epimerase [bacterium]|nr:ribulose-phosphate 3-epimerase [bacterium]
MQIAPSILSSDFARLALEIESIKNCDMVHIDVMDGHFVPNLTFGAPVVKCIRKYTELFFDCHLMISNPLKYAKDFANAGADLITFHYESDDNPKEVIDEIKRLGCKVGISIKPKTKVEEVYPYLDMVDLVLVMSVEPGFGGQSFMAEVLDKVRKLKELKQKENKKYVIEIDGGIDDKTIHLAKEAGVEICVAGSYIFKQKDRIETIKKLKAV